MPQRHKQRQSVIRLLNEELAELSVSLALKNIRDEFSDLPSVSGWLKQVHHDLIHNVGPFLEDGGEHPAQETASNEDPAGIPEQAKEDYQFARQPVDVARDDRFRRYMVNVLIEQNGDNTGDAPIIEELNPTLGNLVGRVEHLSQMGALVTDFLLVKPGALHRANGGYLLIDARKLLMQPLAWEALKRALKNSTIAIESPAEQLSITTTQSLDPEPIPLRLKVILFGDPEIYYQLANMEPEVFALVQGAG